MPGRKQTAAPGEPQCPDEGCQRPAGFATDHAGSGFCRRHDGGRELNQRTRRRIAQREGRPAPASHDGDPSPTPSPRDEPATAEAMRPASAPALVANPLARRLTGSRATGELPDPLGVLRTVLASARAAGYPFGEAWVIGAEAALSYMPSRQAREWWDALTATERAWADAYAQRGSKLDALRR